ncbi:MAG: hypothetical protein MJY78_03320 [Fibrobacter sp.]|nr:hypothetical protein [Fibrobacter sp.]
MEKVEISKDFTVEDIHKIREAHYEEYKNRPIGEYLADIHESAMRVQAQIQALREKRENYTP